MKYDKIYDLQNQYEFSKSGTNRPDEPRYVCTVCERMTSIGGSFSYQGRRLICTQCARKNFQKETYIDLEKLNGWLMEEEC